MTYETKKYYISRVKVSSKSRCSRTLPMIYTKVHKPRLQLLTTLPKQLECDQALLIELRVDEGT